jgi:diguanylate cyclase
MACFRVPMAHDAPSPTTDGAPAKSRAAAHRNTDRRMAHSLALAESAMTALAQHGLAPTPANYALFYDYAAGTRPDLRSAMDSAAAQGPLDEAAMAGLSSRFFLPETEALAVNEALTQLQQALREAIATLTDHGAEAVAFGDQLLELAGAISPEPKRLSNVLQRLAAETQQMINRNRATAGRMSESAAAMESLRAELDAARAEALTDALTSLANRRAFDARLPELMGAAADTGRPLALLMLDLDHFKSINDRFGHAVGDAVLRRTAQTIKGALREQDLAARTGGEEFCAVLPATPMADAMDIADRLRLAVAAQALTLRNTGTRLQGLSISIGLAMRHDGEEPGPLMERADAALYRAKQEGRNRVCNAETPAAEVNGAEAPPATAPIPPAAPALAGAGGAAVRPPVAW